MTLPPSAVRGLLLSVGEPETSQCRTAVERCYSDLRRCGQPDSHALEAAMTVYRFHHPGCSEEQAEVVVSHWVAGPQRH
jgi:hypothetical protein